MNPGISKFYFQLTQDKKAVYPIEAYNFVYDTILYVSRSEAFISPTGSKNIHLSPKKICSLLNNRLKKEFGDYVDLVLKTWGVKAGRDIGVIVFSLSDYGCLKLSGSESQEDFVKAGLGEFS